MLALLDALEDPFGDRTDRRLVLGDRLRGEGLLKEVLDAIVLGRVARPALTLLHTALPSCALGVRGGPGVRRGGGSCPSLREPPRAQPRHVRRRRFCAVSRTANVLRGYPRRFPHGCRLEAAGGSPQEDRKISVGSGVGEDRDRAWLRGGDHRENLSIAFGAKLRRSALRRPRSVRLRGPLRWPRRVGFQRPGRRLQLLRTGEFDDEQRACLCADAFAWTRAVALLMGRSGRGPAGARAAACRGPPTARGRARALG